MENGEMIGQKFGRLTVIRGAEDSEIKSKAKRPHVLVRCDCPKATEKIVAREHLVSGATKSCGCLRQGWVRPNVADLTGQTFGRLTVLRNAEKGEVVATETRPFCYCQCSCGVEKFVSRRHLVSGATTSCGCLKHEVDGVPIADITGQTFGRLTVLQYASREEIWSGSRKSHCVAACTCGKEIVVATRNLTKGITKSCGCLRGENTAAAFVDHSGQTFGRLTVLRRATEDEIFATDKKPHYVCQCRCGAEVVVRKSHLTTGETVSCGCWNSDKMYKHGMVFSPTYASWAAMKDRCSNPKNKNWKRYGGRGITIAPEWNDFTRFVQDMDERPTQFHTLDRINNDGNYEPGNCKWSLPAEQARNTSRTRLYTWNGKSQILADWAKETGINESALYHRINNLGWSIERAVTEPSQSEGRRFLTAKGTTKSLQQWSEESGLDPETISSRIKRGWSVERAVTEPSQKEGNRFLTANGVTKSLAQWSKESGLYRDVISNRIKRGWSVERAVTEPSNYHAPPPPK